MPGPSTTFGDALMRPALGTLADAPPLLADLQARVDEQSTQLEIIVAELEHQIALRREVEADLRASEARFRSLTASAHDAIVTADAQGRIVFWNPGAENIFGYTADEILGQPLTDLLAPDERPVYRRVLLLAALTGELADDAPLREARGLRKSGSAFPLELSLASWGTSDGMLIGAIIRDITERKQAMEDLARISQHNELILKSAGEGIVGLDLDGRATFVNPAAADMTGFADGELIGRSLHAILHPLQPSGPTCRSEPCPLGQTLADCAARSTQHELFWRKDGSRFPVEVSIRSICCEDTVVGAVVTFRDITERLAMEKVKDEFVSVVSHELRTPLTSIRASLGLLAGGVLAAAPDKAQRMLDIAVGNADRLIRLVNDILDIERLESGRADLHPRVCEAAGLVQRAAEEMRGMAQAAGVPLQVGATSGQLVADPDRVLQVLTNLVSNAIKFSAAGQSVELRGGPNGADEIVFSVRDRGRGIAADKLEAIFERFHQVDASDSREKGGTGLGLAICKSIVRQHGGRVWAESTPGQGSTFFVALPIGSSPA